MGLGTEIKEGFAADLEREAARKIIRYIEKWRKGGKIKTAQQRWLFELVQNALDICKQRGTTPLKIEIENRDNEIIVRHNANYFTPEEIRALIYAYSTKPYERESELAGKFATGFLVTHIVSEKVGLRAILNKDGEFYDFSTVIDRKSDDINTIFENFSRSFDQLNYASKIQNDIEEYWTEYTYTFTENIEKEAVNTGISKIRECLPFLFAFNEISKITINGQEYSKEKIMNSRILIEKVGSTHVWIKKDQVVDVAIAVDSSMNKYLNLLDAPRIYVKGLPLIETGDYINTPFTMHSTKLETHEDRDTLTNIDENKEIIKRAFTLYYELVNYVSECVDKKIGELHGLVDFQMIIEERISQNPLWNDFNSVMKESLRKIVEDIPLVETFEGRKETTNVIFPRDIVKSTKLQAEMFEKFYDLLAKIKNNIPIRDELHSWIDLAERLNKEFGNVISISLYGVEDLKNELVDFVRNKEDFPKFEDLNKEYNLSDSRQFLILFFELINQLYKEAVVDSSKFTDYLLPNQMCVIGPLARDDASLCIDESIPEDFKDIVHKIGWEIRKHLLDKDFSDFEIVKDLVRDTKNIEKALEVIVNEYRLETEIKEEQWSSRVTGWIELFRWCVRNKKLPKGFPIITKDNKIQCIENLDSESFLIPFKYMDIAEEFEDIYPSSKILYDKYFEIDDFEKFFDGLKGYETFVTKLPLYKRNVTLGYNKLKAILAKIYEISKVDHDIETTERDISFLPFWSDVIGKISEYPARGKLLFKFVVEYLINRDESWEKYVQINCTCKEKNHKIIPSQWLASLKTDAWVPYRPVESEEEKIVKREATKESIENVFSSDELEELIKTNPDKITRFLMHFDFDELDLKIKLQSIETGKEEELVRRNVSKLVDIARIVPDLPDIASRNIDAFRDVIEKFRERLEKEPIKDENRKIGTNVEKIIKEIISDKGFKVRPVYKGGDLEMWPEEKEGWDSGLIEIAPYFLEIKFTSGERVHLSKAQAEMARNKRKYYIVLVVKNTDGLREKLKLDMNENTFPDDLILGVTKNSYVIEGTYTKLGIMPNPEEVEPDINGYWIKKRLWDKKNSILKWIKQKL